MDPAGKARFLPLQPNGETSPWMGQVRSAAAEIRREGRDVVTLAWRDGAEGSVETGAGLYDSRKASSDLRAIEGVRGALELASSHAPMLRGVVLSMQEAYHPAIRTLALHDGYAVVCCPEDLKSPEEMGASIEAEAVV